MIFFPLGLKAIGNSLDFVTDAISREEETDTFTAMFTLSALAILAFFILHLPLQFGLKGMEDV